MQPWSRMHHMHVPQNQHMHVHDSTSVIPEPAHANIHNSWYALCRICIWCAPSMSSKCIIHNKTGMQMLQHQHANQVCTKHSTIATCSPEGHTPRGPLPQAAQLLSAPDDKQGSLSQMSVKAVCHRWMSWTRDGGRVFIWLHQSKWAPRYLITQRARPCWVSEVSELGMLSYRAMYSCAYMWMITNDLSCRHLMHYRSDSADPFACNPWRLCVLDICWHVFWHHMQCHCSLHRHFGHRWLWDKHKYSASGHVVGISPASTLFKIGSQSDIKLTGQDKGLMVAKSEYVQSLSHVFTIQVTAQPHCVNHATKQRLQVVTWNGLPNLLQAIFQFFHILRLVILLQLGIQAHISLWVTSLVNLLATSGMNCLAH